MRGCGTISACSAAFSATPCATRRAPRYSTWSSASGRPRSGSIATRTSRRGGSSKPSSTACRRPIRCGSFAPSAISRISPTSPRTRTTSARCAARGPRRTAAEHAGPTLSHAQGRRLRRRPTAQLLRQALVSPVLTAHPTEVRRKSTIDREMEIAALLDRRERVQLTPEEIEASDEQLRRAVLTLWQTNLLRRTKLTVLDEVANGLSFYDYTFLREVPRLHCALEDRLNEEEGGAPGELASFLTHGKLDRRRPRRQSVRHRRRHARHAAAAVEPACCNFYLEELHVARRRAVAGGASCRCLRRAARAGRALAGYLAASKRRALSPGGIRHLCAAGGDGAAARGRDHAAAGRRGRALCQRDGVQGRSRRARPLADRQQFRRDRARAAAAVAPRRGLLRLPSRPARHAAEFRRA